MLEAVVGSVAAEKVLLYLQNYEQAYGREIAATFGISNSQVQKQLLELESGGLLVSRLVGRTTHVLPVSRLDFQAAARFADQYATSLRADDALDCHSCVARLPKRSGTAPTCSMSPSLSN